MRKVKAHGGQGADGVHGGRAIWNRLDEIAGGIRSDVGTERGAAARINYLTRSARGAEAMERAGLEVSERTMLRWLAEEQQPSKANQARLDEAYRMLRHENVSAQLKAKLTAGGAGTRIEIHPEGQGKVVPQYRRDLSVRTINVRDWGSIVDAWVDDDDAMMEAIWDDICGDVGSDGGAYEYVAAIGF
jgi:hypothetical protein